MSVDSGPVAHALLGWYDRHARRLPWRPLPGELVDPYRIWLSEIMLQQTTVAAARRYFEAFTTRWPTVEALAAADETEVMAAWAGLGYYARARNLVACARTIAAGGGAFPDEEAGLRLLPGIGRYTAAAIAAIAFGRRAVVVDANVERVVARLAAIATPLPAARRQIEARTDAITPLLRAGDFAQAMMDLGATICGARAPACGICPLFALCDGRRAGAPERFPVKPAKVPRPIRHGTIFWLEAHGRVLLIRRPKSGLLGGMLALPSGPWAAEDPGLADMPADAVTPWIEAGCGRHVFTHFTLEYKVMRAEAVVTDVRDWRPIEQVDGAGLPTIFRAAARLVTARTAVAA